MSPTPTLSVQQAFALALQHHQAGRLAEAEVLYQQIVAVQPHHAEALHYLGVIAHQTGRQQAALERIRQALAIAPGYAAAYSNLGEVYRSVGKLDEAVQSFRRAVELQPELAEGHNNLGNALREQGKLEESVTACRRALELRPQYPEAWNNLGIAFIEQGDLQAAAAAYRRALDLRPDYASAWNHLGEILSKLGRLDEALAACRRALQLDPGLPEGHNTLGTILLKRGQPGAAAEAYRRALQCKADFAEAHHNLGFALASQGLLEAAIDQYRQALRLRPGLSSAHNHLGMALTDAGRFEEAAAAYREAIRRDAENAHAHSNLGVILAREGRLDEAVEQYRRAIVLQPQLVEAHNNLGNALKDQGRLVEALAETARAHELQPQNAAIHSNLICDLHFLPGGEEKIVEEQGRWNRQFGGLEARWVEPHGYSRDPQRSLRIGYVSADFREHAVGYNILPLFRNHDAGNFEVICYSAAPRPDTMTDRLRRSVEHWREIAAVSDERVAQMIREDAVDILVDLSQHTAGNRLPVFARRPAPVQVSFAGYPEGAGLDAIEHRISDRFLLSPCEAEAVAGKEAAHCIDSFWCYEPYDVSIEVAELPANKNRYVTFGCLNNFCKINEPVLDLWARVLARVKESRLLILATDGSHRRKTQEYLECSGVDGSRVEFAAPRPRRDYLELYHRVDVILDTWPYNGHTTSLDALWMGVPVISLVGRPAVARAGLSQLSHLGLAEWAAFTEEGYVETAAKLAEDSDRLAVMRASLRSRMEASVLMDGKHFVRSIEQAYRSMWQRWCAQHTSVHQ